MISPYHYRLDWLMWFAAFQSYQQNPWLIHLMVKLLAGDSGVRSLIAHDPFADSSPPRFMRAELFEYTYSDKAGLWWDRKAVSSYIPPISLQTQGVRQFMDNYGWQWPQQPGEGR